MKNSVYKMGLYGSLIKNPVAYCKKHQCYLEPLQIKEKKCNYKKCNYLREIKWKKNLIIRYL
jgi:hypothetical protein